MTRSERDPATRWVTCDDFPQSERRLGVDERTDSVPLSASEQFRRVDAVFHVKHPFVSNRSTARSRTRAPRHSSRGDGDAMVTSGEKYPDIASPGRCALPRIDDRSVKFAREVMTAKWPAASLHDTSAHVSVRIATHLAAPE